MFFRPLYMCSYHPGWTIVILCSHLNKSLFGKLQLVQNAAARLLCWTSCRTSALAYISELLMPYSTGRTLRSSDQELLTIPQSKLKMRDDCDFVVVAPRLWNSLPNNIRLAETVDSFKRLLKTFLNRQAFN
ncbi:hypothetical protein LDENG_00211110 [Lucifuga dentata]|nr:hypothetical protein LDENG_00211110 [Lucifuga dentata]